MATQLITVLFTFVFIAVHLIAVHSAPVTNEVRLLSQLSGRFVRVTENGAHSAPVTNEVRLLSQLSGRFVRVTENGAIIANGNLKSSAVFKMYLKNSQIQFELKNKPGMFLMLKELNNSMVEDVVNTTSSPVNITANQTISHEYALVVDYPSESHLTEWERSGLCGALVMKVDEDTNCAIAFDGSGKVAGPCNTNHEDCIAIQ